MADVARSRKRKFTEHSACDACWKKRTKCQKGVGSSCKRCQQLGLSCRFAVEKISGMLLSLARWLSLNLDLPDQKDVAAAKFLAFSPVKPWTLKPVDDETAHPDNLHLLQPVYPFYSGCLVKFSNHNKSLRVRIFKRIELLLNIFLESAKTGSYEKSWDDYLVNVYSGLLLVAPGERDLFASTTFLLLVHLSRSFLFTVPGHCSEYSFRV